ncbi:MAG: hydrogenase maturation protease [Chloroflexi bacterium]|nr:hydrogenase maturation protease [Chloroflexota bacterium]
MGNEHRSDDGVGIWVARQIAGAGWEGLVALALDSGDGTVLLSAWQGAERVYVVDAVVGAAPPGTIIRLDLLRQSLAGGLRALSSHGLGLVEAVELGRALDLLPGQLVLYGIVGRSFEHGKGLSPEVEHAARRVLARLRRAVSTGGQGEPLSAES